MEPLEDIIGKINSIEGVCIYDIHHRKAGWGISYFDEKQMDNSKNYKTGLILYHYYPTLREALEKTLHDLLKR